MSNILFLTAWYPNKFFPLNGNFIKKHAKAISEICNVNVLFVHPDSEIKKYNYCIKRQNSLNEYILYYPAIKSSIPIISKLFKITTSLFYTFKGIKRIKNETGRPDLIHVNILTRLGIVALYYKIFFKIPYIITEHWTGYLNKTKHFKGFVNKKITALAVKNAFAVTVVSEQLKNAMLNHNLKNKNYRIVYNVIDTNLFKNKTKTTKTIKEIIHITNFKDEHKNISGILNVIKRLSNTRTDFKLNIVGIGVSKKKFEKYAEDLNIKDKFVFFLGKKEGKELVNLINNSCFMLMFSNYETFQIPVIESLSCGVPVLTTMCGGILDNSEEQFGKIIEPDNENELYNNIIYMLDNYKKYSPVSLRKYAEDNYGKEKVAQQFVDIYNDALYK